MIDLAYWDAPFVAWLERHGYPVEYCTDLDLHEDPGLLSSYDLLLSVGHDEYWSAAMRTHAERFVHDGGNIAFLSANACWWRVHPTDRNTAFVSDTDHHVGDEYPHLPATDQWWALVPDGVGNPENALTGVSFRNGGMWPATEWPGDRPRVGYTVQHADHWIFEGTGLRDGSDGGTADRLGAGTPLIGYECDGAAFSYDESGIARATGEDGTPDSFLILGIHVLEPVHEDFHHFKWGHWNGPVREPSISSPRAATMGLYTAAWHRLHRGHHGLARGLRTRTGPGRRPRHPEPPRPSPPPESTAGMSSRRPVIRAAPSGRGGATPSTARSARHRCTARIPAVSGPSTSGTHMSPTNSTRSAYSAQRSTSVR